MTATTLRIDAPIDDLDLPGSQIGRGNGQGICLARPTCSGGRRSDNLPQLPIYPDGNMMELTRTASSSRAATRWSGRREAALETIVRSSNGFLSALSADDYELIRPHLRT